LATIPAKPGALAAAPVRLSRSGLFLGLVLLAALNSFAGIAAATIADHGIAYAVFELFGVSAIVWAALAAALALLRNGADAPPPSRGDYAMAVLVLLAALSPVATASSLALTLLAIWMIVTSAPESPGRKAGIVALAMTGSLIWGRLTLAMFSRPLLDADTWLVGRLTGARQAGNTLAFLDGTGGIAVAPGCSSWQGMSLAFLLWVTMAQWFGVRLSWRSAGWCLLALAATVAINVLRIAAMVRFPAHMAEIHHGYGWHISMWATLVAVTAICTFGARREIFGR
jgi:exosortase/archaeosortase family protein